MCACPWASTFTTLFFVTVFFAMDYCVLLSSLLLVSNGLSSTLASASIVLCALSSKRKSKTMSDTTVATDVHKALDVELGLTTEISLYLISVGNLLSDAGSLLVSPVLDLNVAINASSIEDASSTATPYTVYIGQGYLTSLVLWQIDAYNSYCHTLYTV